MVFSNPFTVALAATGVLCPLAQGAPAPVPAKRGDNSKFDFGNDKVRGVNLGGWLVLEPWITPSIFEATPKHVVDEWTMSATLGKSEMTQRMHKHWDTWITADDFSEMASYGINFVRIPIGYWSVSPIAGDPYIQGGAYGYLAKAIGWASDNGIKVMIDLHGAPGSQNGFDNSGRKGPINWGTGKTFQQTHKALNKIRDDHASNPAVATIELVNEPLGSTVGMKKVSQFYYDGWGDLKNAPVTTTIHDAFDLSYWNSWGDGLTDVVVDTHHYEVFTPGYLKKSISQHVKSACSFGGEMASGTWPTISGEWTGAMTDCAKWLNGRNTGSRYDGTYDGSPYIGSCEGLESGTVSSLSSEQKQNVGTFIEAQMVAYEKAAGWIFWAWKTESAPEWDFQALAGAGVIPSLDSLDYSVCGSWS